MTPPETGVPAVSEIAERLAALYDQPFGGKRRGRYRVSMKLLCGLFGRQRIWPEQVVALQRALYERGYALVDLEAYFVVVSHNTFTNYRRVNDAVLSGGGDDDDA
jgi:hypothetical protein